MYKINGLLSVFLTTLIAVIATPVFGYLVDYDSNSQDLYYYWRLTTNGYLYAETRYDQPQDYSSIYTYLRITGYTSFGAHKTMVQLLISPVQFSDFYHDVWEFGMGTDTSSEWWYGYNPNHNTGPISLIHRTEFWSPKQDQQTDTIWLSL